MAKRRQEYKINWETIQNIENFDAEYDAERDIFYMHSKKQRPAVSIDIDGEIWLRVDPLNGEIIGIEIEDFREVILKKHPEILGQAITYARPSVTNFISEQLAKCPA